MREANYINIAIGHLLLEVTSEGFNKEETLLNCWDGSWIQGFGNVHSIRVMAKLGGMTHQVELLEKPEGIRKNRTVLGRLGLMVRPDGIWLDSLT